jgi:hypothetical protein
LASLAQTQEWLERRQAEMLPVPYFHITITVPAELRAVLRAQGLPEDWGCGRRSGSFASVL